uniref:Reverse transcriptase domain-containing protein n=1 Tax=Oreochromis aureus TaxID=47969 RepID=A0A668S264_OREAU
CTFLITHMVLAGKVFRGFLGVTHFNTLFYLGKIILCIDFVVFCLRLMAIFTISRTLGPKIIIMMDMFFFMFLLSIWVVAYGVAKQGILIHNENRLDWIIRGVVYEPYLIIFGQFPKNIDSDVNATDPLKPKCPVLNENQSPVFPEWLTIIMLCVYLLFANILLLNLLIAIFNFTFEEVQDNTDKIWKFQRYELIKEYHSRPAAPPPFIILSHIYLFIRSMVLRRPAKIYKEFKGKDKLECSNYRPISVLNIDYKLFTSIISKRLEMILPIHNDQTGFIKQRQAQDNIRKVLHILRQVDKQKLETLVLSLDAEKAFDSVRWSFLYKVLEKFNFDKSIIDIISGLYNKSTARIKINGDLTESFILERGTRQGCCISPLLFALFIEPLSQWIRQRQDITGVRTPGGEQKLALFALHKPIPHRHSPKSWKHYHNMVLYRDIRSM